MFEKEILEVEKCYEEYGKFIKNDMPELHIEIEFIRGVSATLNSKSAYEGVYLVHINPELFSCSKKYRDSVLFHEFTHICDCTKIGENR